MPQRSEWLDFGWITQPVQGGFTEEVREWISLAQIIRVQARTGSEEAGIDASVKIELSDGRHATLTGDECERFLEAWGGVMGPWAVPVRSAS